MTVSQVRFIDEDGNDVQRDVSTSSFGVKIAGVIRQPAIVTEVEIENDGGQSTTGDQCGNIQRRRATNEGWMIRVTGIVTANDDRRDNLSMQKMRDVVAPSDSIEIVSDLASGEYTLSNTVITEANDLVSVMTASTDGEEQAFEFQLQLGDTESAD